MLQESEVRVIVAAVIAEQKRQQSEDLDDVVIQTIATILRSFGIQEDDYAEMRLDFAHLRRWRRATEQIERSAWKAIVWAIVTGGCGLIVAGLQAKLHLWK